MPKLINFVVACGILSFALPAAAANLIVNGDFATGDLTGWTLTAQSPAFVQPNYPASSGCPGGAGSSNYCLYRKDADSAISQTVKSRPGSYLHIHEDVGVPSFAGTPNKDFLPAEEIQVNGETVAFASVPGSYKLRGRAVSTGNDVISFIHHSQTNTIIDHIVVFASTTD